jgi:hypothetical protein
VKARVAVEIDAALQCELNGHPVSCVASDGVIVIKTESPTGVRELIRFLRGSGNLRSVAAGTSGALVASSQRLELRVGDAVVLEMGRGIRSRLLRLAGLPNVRIWPLRLIRMSASS